MWIENRKDVRTGKGNCQSKVAIAKLHLGHSDSQYVFTIVALCDVDIGGMGKTRSVPAQNGPGDHDWPHVRAAALARVEVAVTDGSDRP